MALPEQRGGQAGPEPDGGSAAPLVAGWPEALAIAADVIRRL
jgi:hypothetical protein